MGASSAGIQLVAEQIKRYYIFQKKLKMYFLKIYQQNAEDFLIIIIKNK